MYIRISITFINHLDQLKVDGGYNRKLCHLFIHMYKMY